MNVDTNKVILDISMSLDGFVRASGYGPEAGLGVGGERLHEWAFGKAKAAAPGKDVFAMGGAELAQAMLRAELVDEIGIHLVPVLLHDGLRLFEHLGPEHTQLEVVEVLDTPLATHLRYRVAGRT